MEQYTRKVRRSPPRLVDNLELMTVRAAGLAGRARASRRAQDAGAFCLIHDFVVVRGGVAAACGSTPPSRYCANSSHLPAGGFAAAAPPPSLYLHK